MLSLFQSLTLWGYGSLLPPLPHLLLEEGAEAPARRQPLLTELLAGLCVVLQPCIQRGTNTFDQLPLYFRDVGLLLKQLQPQAPDEEAFTGG